MSFALYFSRRITFQGGRPLSRLAVWLAALSVGLGIAVINIATSVTVAFEEEIQRKIIGFAGDIQITGYMPSVGETVQRLKADDPVLALLPAQFKMVASVAPYIDREGVLKTPEGLEGVQMHGVDAKWDKRFLEAALKQGRLPEFPKEGYGKEILVSQKLADVLLLKPGARAQVYFLEGGKVRMRPVTVTGVYSTGMADFDRTFVLCDIRLLQRIIGWDAGEVQGFTVHLEDSRTAEAVCANMNEYLPFNQEAQTSARRFNDIFTWLEFQHQNVLFILIVMTLVAMLNMATALIIVISERTATIGLLKALGATEGMMRRLFIWNAFFIIVMGAVGGNLLAVVLMWVQDTTGVVKLDPDSYFIATAPIAWAWEHFLTNNILVIALCTFAMTGPALLAQRIRPSRAIQ